MSIISIMILMIIVIIIIVILIIVIPGPGPSRGIPRAGLDPAGFFFLSNFEQRCCELTIIYTEDRSPRARPFGGREGTTY